MICNSDDGEGSWCQKTRGRINAHWSLLLTTANLALVMSKSVFYSTMLMHSVWNRCKNVAESSHFLQKFIIFHCMMLEMHLMRVSIR